MTRAKEELIITASGEASGFLGEISSQNVERENTKKELPFEEATQLSLFDFLS